MSYEEATAILCDIERNVDVTCLRHDGLEIWPLLRLMLWRQLTGGGDARPAAAAAARTEGPLGKLRLAARALLRSGRGLSKASAVFFVAGGERSVVMEGKALSPIGDSLKDYARMAGISSVTLDASQDVSPYGEPFSARPEIALAFLRARLARLTGAAAAVPGLEELDTYLKRAYPELPLDRAQLLEELRLIAGAKRSFLPLLKAIAPKAVFLACYYHPIAMGLILACRARRVRTIEVQHGQQGDYHGMYANWTKAGPGGYALMPDNFWCWGQQSADRINKWSRPSWPQQQAIVGGNPWMARQIHQPDSAAEEAQLSKVFAAGKTHVLVALQPVEDAWPTLIREAIAQSPPQIRWLIRFHPKMAADRKAEIRTTLTETGRDNFEMDLASSLPLAKLLKRADFVITLWSSVAYEALLFGAHPIIAHENGLKSFKSYIDRGLFSYAVSSQDILGLMVRGRPQRIVEDDPYIETREDVIFNKLRWSVS